MKAKDLRNSILQLAVQGKLVPQDPSDEPASILLERIRAERAKLIKEKKIKAPKGGESVIYRASDGSHYEKRGKGEPVCIDDEIPFEIPESWAWVRMGSVLTFVNGRAYKKPELLSEGKYPVLRVGNLFTNSAWYYSNLELPEEKYCHHGDLLYAWSASFGPTVWQGDTCIFHYHIWNVLHSDQLDRDYLYWFLLEDVNRVKRFTTGSTMIHVSMEHMIPRLLAIPPLHEQKRIVAKLREVIPHIDDYDVLEDARERLDAELPDRLRKSILQLAVQGKLVEQNPTDEPASVLLERIRAERAVLVKAKKIKAPKGGESAIYRTSDGGYYEKRGKGEPDCIDDEVPFDIPDGWEWVRLWELGDCVEHPFADGPFGSNLKREHYVAEPDVRIIQLSNIGEDGWRNDNVKYTSTKHLSTIARSEVRAGDIVIAKMMPAGRAIIVPTNLESRFVLSSDAIKFSPHPALNKDYLVRAINSPMFRSQITAEVHGITRIRTSLGKIQGYLIPLPPRAEQDRIVKDIDACWGFTNQ